MRYGNEETCGQNLHKLDFTQSVRFHQLISSFAHKQLFVFSVCSCAPLQVARKQLRQRGHHRFQCAPYLQFTCLHARCQDALRTILSCNSCSGNASTECQDAHWGARLRQARCPVTQPHGFTSCPTRWLPLRLRLRPDSARNQNTTAEPRREIYRNFTNF